MLSLYRLSAPARYDCRSTGAHFRVGTYHYDVRCCWLCNFRWFPIGAPFQWAALFKKDTLRFIKGVNALMFYNSDKSSEQHELPCKVSCSKCHSPLADEGKNMWMSFPTSFQFQDGKVPAAFKPTCHIFYGSRCMDIKDGTDKWEGLRGKSKQISETWTTRHVKPVWADTYMTIKSCVCSSKHVKNFARRIILWQIDAVPLSVMIHFFWLLQMYTSSMTIAFYTIWHITITVRTILVSQSRASSLFSLLFAAVGWQLYPLSRFTWHCWPSQCIEPPVCNQFCKCYSL